MLQLLRQLVNDATDTEGGAAVAGGDSQSSAVAEDDAEVDPMYALEGMASVADALAEIVASAKKASPMKRKFERACVHELVIPARPMCAGGADGATTSVFVYSPTYKNKTNSVLYLRTDCMGWLLAYGADDGSSQGVCRAETSAEHAAPRSNCPAVADLHLEWSFAEKAWDAVFLGGPSQ